MKNKYSSIEISFMFFTNEDIVTFSAGASDLQKLNDLVCNDIFGD